MSDDPPTRDSMSIEEATVSINVGDQKEIRVRIRL